MHSVRQLLICYAPERARPVRGFPGSLIIDLPRKRNPSSCRPQFSTGRECRMLKQNRGTPSAPAADSLTSDPIEQAHSSRDTHRTLRLRSSTNRFRLSSRTSSQVILKQIDINIRLNVSQEGKQPRCSGRKQTRSVEPDLNMKEYLQNNTKCNMIFK